MKIALDAMGGDFGPPNLVAGAVMALREYPHINKLFLVGDYAADRSRAEEASAATIARIEIVHSTQVVEMSDSAMDSGAAEKRFIGQPRGRSGQTGEADAIVSAGHTGAAVAATHDQAAHAARDRSSRHRGGHSDGDERLRFDRCRREHRRAPRTSSAIRNHGLGLFAPRARLQESERRS